MSTPLFIMSSCKELKRLLALFTRPDLWALPLHLVAATGQITHISANLAFNVDSHF